MNKEERRLKRLEKAPKASWLYRLVKIFGWLPMNILYPTKVYGNRNIGKKKVIIAMNHLSAVDPLMIAHIFSPSVYFMAKGDFMKKPGIAWLLNNLGCIFVRRGEPDMNATKRAFGVLESGKALGVFPEGTRNKNDDGSFLRLKTGVAYFAIKAEAPVVPMVIDRKLKAFRRNSVIIGDEIDMSEFYCENPGKDALAGATRKLQAEMLRLRGELDKLNGREPATEIPTQKKSSREEA